MSVAQAVTERGLDPGGLAPTAPEWLILGINNVCNLHCRMCDVGLGDEDTAFWANLIGRHPENMSLARYERILDQALAFGPPPKLGLVYTEPLIHPEILEFVAAGRRRGLFTSVTTNGMALPKLAADLVVLELDQLVLSIDGPPEIHNRVRGHRRSFERLLEGARLVNEAKDRAGVDRPSIAISHTITDLGLGHLTEFLAAVREMRPASIYACHLNFISEQMAAVHNAVAPPELHVVRSNLGEQSPADFDLPRLWADLRAAQELADQWGGTPEVRFVPDLESPERLATYYRDELAFIGGRDCRAPWKMMMVRTDGRVIPAQGRCFSATLGQIDDEPLDQIWNGDRFRTLRRALAEHEGTLPACARCCGVVGRPATKVG